LGWRQVPSNTQCGMGRGLPAYQVPSILIPPTLYHNRPTSQTGQERQTDNGPIRNGYPTMSIKMYCPQLRHSQTLNCFAFCLFIARFIMFIVCMQMTCQPHYREYEISANVVPAWAKRLHLGKRPEKVWQIFIFQNSLSVHQCICVRSITRQSLP